MSHEQFGRGLVCLPGATVPAPFEQLPRVRVDADTLRDPALSLDLLHTAWLERKPLVIELALSKAELKQKERWEGNLYELEPAFELARERLHFLVWANNYDATVSGEPVWWHGRLSGDPQCDGGPRGDFAGLHRESTDSRQPTRLGPRQGLSLAPDQEAAVLHRSGPARILAPAGSGKTRVLTERLRHLLVDRGYERDRVTALAYNRRAAEEMRQRTADFQPQVATLHALGYSLLGRPRLADERQVRGILHGLLKHTPVLNQDPLAAYIEALSMVRLGLRSPEEVERGRTDIPGFAALFPVYRKKLAERGLVDHDEQIYGALERLLADPELRARAQRRCTHLLVDEFQDLTPAYLLLVRLLAAPAYQVFGVGDDDQVIYGYAGATPAFLVDFQRYFPGAASYQLEVNYRCPRGVVQATGSLLRRNHKRVPKNVRPGPGAPPGELTVLKAPLLEWSGQALRQVQSWLESHPPGQIAVLSRVQASLLPLHAHLAACDLPFRGVLDETVLQRTGLRTALAYLRLAAGEFSRPDLNDALRRPNRKLRREIVDEVAGCESLDCIERVAREQEAWPESQLLEFVAELRVLSRQKTSGALLRYLREQVGLGDAMRDLDNDAAASHLDDLVALEQTAPLHPERDGFEEWLRELLSRPGRPGIRLSTVHRVKGMEWDCVLVYGAQQGLLPHRLAEDGEEERRIFHVAITRARRELVVLADREEPSRFLEELSPPGDASRLKGKERKVYELHLAGLSLEEIAGQMGKSPAACQTWLQLARSQVE